MKFRRIAGAAALASLFLFAACSSTPSLALTANWYSNTKNYGEITGTSESLTYTVKFVPNASYSGNVNVEYEAGKLTMALRDINVSASNPVENVPTGSHVYHLHSEYSMTGKFSYKGQQTDAFTDAFTSDVYFLGVADSLRPIYSSKRVESHIPFTGAEKLEDVCVQYSYLYTAAYNDALTETTITQRDLASTDEAEVTTRKLSGGGTFLDNEQILFAIRGLDLSASFTFRTVNPAGKSTTSVYTPEAPSMEDYTANFSMQVGSGEAKTVGTVKAARLKFGYNAANPGQTQTAVYARCTNPDENLYRNVLLHLEIDALYSLGTFHYDLSSAVFNNK